MSKKAIVNKNTNSSMLNRAFNNQLIVKNEITGELSPVG